jgi:hypothetical protein
MRKCPKCDRELDGKYCWVCGKFEWELRPKAKCPQFIVDRMERLKKQPPPTPEQVERQMKGSIAQRKKMGL